MDQQLKLWLAPPILMGVAYIYFRIKIPLAWSWGFLLQGLLLVIAGSCGYLFGPEWLFVLISWLLFFSFLIIPKILIAKCDQCVALADPKRLFFLSRFFPYIYWGQMGAFWQDLYQSNSLALDGKAEEARKTIDKWKGMAVPKSVEVQLDATTTGINLILWDFDRVIADYDDRLSKQLPISVILSVQAARAFCEKRDFERAAVCLESSRLSETRADRSTLAFILLPFFCMTGEQNYANELLGVLKGSKRLTAKFLIVYWQARLAAAQGRLDEARNLFAKSLEFAQQTAAQGRCNFSVWKKRIEQQLEILDSSPNIPVEQDLHETATRVWRLFADTNFVASAIRPQKTQRVVNALCLILIIAYLLSGCVDMVASSWSRPLLNANINIGNQIVDLSETLGNFAFNNFTLDRESFFKGEYFRLFTYMFLHGNITHLFLNVVAIYWFGKRAASIFSPNSFLVIFVLTGLAGGLAHIFFATIPVIGASGGVLGIFGACFAGIFRLKNKLPEKLRKAELTSMSVLAVSQLLLDHVIPKISGETHMGGLFAGLALGMLLPLAKEKEPDTGTSA